MVVAILIPNWHRLIQKPINKHELQKKESDSRLSDEYN